MKILLKAREWFRDLQIRDKILVVYIPLIVVPLFLLGFVSYRISTNTIINNTLENALNNSQLIITRINTMLLNAENCANILAIDINKEHLPALYAGNKNVSYLETDFRIRNQISNAELVFPDVDSVFFIDNYNRVYSPNDDRKIDPSQLVNHPMLLEIERSNGQNIWFPMQIRDILVNDTKTPVLTLGKKIINMDTAGQKLGILIVNIRESSISSIYDTQSANHTEYAISDPSGKIISSHNKSNLLKSIRNPVLREWLEQDRNGGTIETINHQKMLMTSTPFPRFGWKMISQAPLEELTAGNQRITYAIIVIGIICLLIALFSAGLLSRLIARPIIRLSKEMIKVNSGNLDVQYHFHSKDEIGILSTGFNTMIQRIQDLLHNINLEQKKKREFELALIQAQIKPHFLYNTLETIYSLSALERKREAQKTIKALADFYRGALNKGKETITVQEEMKIVNSYLSIQRIRYSDVFDFEINVDPDILHHRILKLIVQPLVENSIYHGLKTKGSLGKISIVGYQTNDEIIVKVIDDGVGISEEKLTNLVARNNGERNSASFGLSSVDERIKLFFGEKYGISIQSKLGAGTEVTITIPMLQEGGLEHDRHYDCG